MKDFINLVKSTYDDLFFNINSLLGFLVFYHLFGSYIILPLGARITNWITKYLGYSSLTFNNVISLPLNPLFLLVGFSVLLLYAVYAFFEINTIAYCIYESHHKRKITLLSLMGRGLVRSLDILKPRNWGAIIYIIVLVPLIRLGLTDDFINSIDIPSFILEYINQVWWMQLIYYISLIAITIFVFFATFSFFYYCFEKVTFYESILKSIRFVRKRFFTILEIEIEWFFFSLLAIGSIYFLVNIIILNIATYLSGIVQELENINVFLSAGLGILSASFSTFNISISIATTAATVAFLFNFFFVNVSLDLKKSYVKATKRDIHLQKYFLIPIFLVIFFGTVTTRSLLSWHSIRDQNYLIGINGPEITAHRGASKYAPENTASAFELAIEQGAEYIELDVIETLDGVLVVAHDNNLRRRFKQRYVITKSTYEELLNADLGSYFGKEFAGERILTLEEAIQICRGRIKMNIELKPHNSDVDLVQKAIDLIDQYDMKDQCVISSIDLPVLFKVLEIDPEITTCFNTSIAFAGLELLPFNIFSVEKDFLTNEAIERIHAVEKKVWVWTVNTQDEMELFIRDFVDNIITDNVPLAKRVVENELKSLSTENENLIQNYLMRLLFVVN